MDRYKQLEKMIKELILKDDLIEEKKQDIKNIGLIFSKNELHLEIDYRTLSSELFINMQLKESKKFMDYFNIETIDFNINNFEFTVNEVSFFEEESKFVSLKKRETDEDEHTAENKHDNLKRTRKLEDEVNMLLSDLREEYIKLGDKIDELLEKNFSDFIEDDNAKFKDKMSNFVKSFKTRRTKAFVKSIIKSGVTSKRREYTFKMDEYKIKITKKLLLEDGVKWSEWGQFFRERKIYKERDLTIKKLLDDMKNYLDDIIDDVFIDLAREAFELEQQFKKYSKADDNYIEVDKRVLLNETWKECKILFSRLGLNQNEFRRF
jgi:hypothetical protein